MSKRNTQEAKRAARERLREEREKAAKRDKLRRQFYVAGGVVGILGLTAFIGVTVANSSKGGDATDWELVERQVAGELKDGDEPYPEDAPAHASGDDGLTIALGDPDAPHTLTFYEEPRCGGCASFEQTMGDTIHAGIDAGDFNAEYVFGTFFDDNPQVGGTGSINAITALGAALDVSPEAFKEYQAALYTQDHHTSANGIDDFNSDAKLIKIGKDLDALSEPADFRAFEAAVKDSTFAVWAARMSQKFEESGVGSTPTVMLDGEQIETPETPEMLEAQLAAAAQGGQGDGADGDEGEEGTED